MSNAPPSKCNPGGLRLADGAERMGDHERPVLEAGLPRCPRHGVVGGFGTVNSDNDCTVGDGVGHGMALTHTLTVPLRSRTADAVDHGSRPLCIGGFRSVPAGGVSATVPLRLTTSAHRPG
jgi:hypothetical protein